PGAARKASDATETAATPGAARKASDATETAATPGAARKASDATQTARGTAPETADAAAATPGAAREASDATETAATPGAARKASDATETARGTAPETADAAAATRGAAAGAARRAAPGAVRDAAQEAPRVPLVDPLPALDLTAPGDDGTRIAVLDAHFLALPLTPDPQIPLATRLVAQIRETRDLRKVSDVADAAGLSPRSLQRLFATHVGVTPKWTILRYRLHEALDQAAHAPDWPALAADLGYADQSHLIRSFTKTLGVPPEAYVQALG
ncbi:helix-turn-helix domain-containing protein, partial [Streptomyces acidiscabies]|uniref:helix-turn-helix domain-containing protein n=1 Tax=Streptomyces acidiscabies TaxID=42234 RepID=UPI0038F6D190